MGEAILAAPGAPGSPSSPGRPPSSDRRLEAFEEGGPPVAYATALGFLASFLISAA